MKKLILILFSFAPLLSFAQMEEDTLIDMVDIEEIALQDLIDVAIMNSSIVKAADKQAMAEQKKADIQKRRWLSGISMIGQYTYGSTGVYSVQDDNFTSESYNVVSTSNASRWVIGTNVKIPLDQIANRRNQLELIALNTDMRVELKNKEIQYLTQSVFNFYNELVTQKAIINVYSDALESNTLNLQMAQRQFSAGEIELVDLSRVIEGYTKSKVQYEKAKRDYRLAYSNLEILIGQSINTLR